MKRTILLTITISIAAMLWPALSFAAERPQIVGGQAGTIPSIALIQWTDAEGNQSLCTGTVVSPSVILSAAHCATGTPVTYQVTTFPSGNPVNSTVAQVIANPAFNEANNDTDDVAVLVLTSPQAAPGIALSPAEPSGGTGALITGFGETYAGSGVSGIADYAPTVIQSNRYCAGVLGSAWASTDMCALDYPANDTSIGSGDSGGPLAIQLNGQLVEVGISDRGASDDDTTLPSVFTRIDKEYGWIEAQIAANGGGGTALVNPPPAPMFRAPRLKGDTLAKARRAVRAHFKLGRVYGHGRIVRQSPLAGTEHKQGSVINVWERGSRVTDSGSVGGRG
jgi:secreted trypsin-like serine protease